MQIKEAIKSFLNENLLSLDSDMVIGDEDNFFEKGFVNSLFAMKLLRFVENKFNIVIDPEDMNLENFSSIQNITILVESKISSNEASS